MAQINFRDKCRRGPFDLLSLLTLALACSQPASQPGQPAQRRKEQNGGYRWVSFFYPQKVVWLLKPIPILLPQAREITTICLGTRNKHRHKSCIQRLAPWWSVSVKLRLIIVSLAFTSSSFSFRCIINLNTKFFKVLIIVNMVVEFPVRIQFLLHWLLCI